MYLKEILQFKHGPIKAILGKATFEWGRPVRKYWAGWAGLSVCHGSHTLSSGGLPVKEHKCCQLHGFVSKEANISTCHLHSPALRANQKFRKIQYFGSRCLLEEVTVSG